VKHIDENFSSMCFLFQTMWCGPCLADNKDFAPHKSKFDPDEVAFVYLTNETSPIDTWRLLIPELTGEH